MAGAGTVISDISTTFMGRLDEPLMKVYLNFSDTCSRCGNNEVANYIYS